MILFHLMALSEKSRYEENNVKNVFDYRIILIISTCQIDHCSPSAWWILRMEILISNKIHLISFRFEIKGACIEILCGKNSWNKNKIHDDLHTSISSISRIPVNPYLSSHCYGSRTLLRMKTLNGMSCMNTAYFEIARKYYWNSLVNFNMNNFPKAYLF